MSNKKIAEERMEILAQEAEKIYKQEPKLAKRYIKLAEKIGQKTETPVPKKIQKKYCNNCKIILKPEKTRVNQEKGFKYKICQDCGHKNKTPLERK